MYYIKHASNVRFIKCTFAILTSWVHEIWQAFYSPVCIFKIIFSSSIISCNFCKCLLIDFYQNDEITFIGLLNCRTNTPRKQGGLGNMKIPLLADKTMEISRAYGVLKEDDGISFRWDTCQSKPIDLFSDSLLALALNALTIWWFIAAF